MPQGLQKVWQHCTDCCQGHSHMGCCRLSQWHGRIAQGLFCGGIVPHRRGTGFPAVLRDLPAVAGLVVFLPIEIMPLVMAAVYGVRATRTAHCHNRWALGCWAKLAGQDWSHHCIQHHHHDVAQPYRVWSEYKQTNLPEHLPTCTSPVCALCCCPCLSAATEAVCCCCYQEQPCLCLAVDPQHHSCHLGPHVLRLAHEQHHSTHHHLWRR